MLTPEQAALVKAMRARGDLNHHIAAWLATNQGRPAEINTGEEYPEIEPAPTTKLPPRGAPVNHLMDAIFEMKDALILISKGCHKDAKDKLELYISNLTRGTDFFNIDRLL